MAGKNIYLEHDTVVRLLDSIKNKRDKALFTITYGFGLRVTEAINLKLSDIDTQRGIIKIMPLKRKNKVTKMEFPLSAQHISLIQDYLSVRPKTDIQNLFVSKYLDRRHWVYKEMTRVNIFKLFQKYCNKIHIKKPYDHPHVLRHSIAVAMAHQGVDIYTAKEILRHAKVASTEEYYQIASKVRSERTAKLHKVLGL